MARSGQPVGRYPRNTETIVVFDKSDLATLELWRLQEDVVKTVDQAVNRH